jgi:iron complex outermembrane receptor protein
MTKASSRARLVAATSPFAVAMMLATAGPAFAQTAPPTPEQQAAAAAAAQQKAAAAQDAAAAAQDAAAAAQDAAAAAQGEQNIVITGIRASLAQSERIKRNQAVIIEAISAEDIGKLPDVSIADSLARLPGVTAQRLEGRDQRLSIRGLGPDFGMTLLNGREQVTVGDNRGVEYDQYPSEFFRNVIVYKSANAAIIPSGISGTVDLRMLRPLSERRTFAVSLRGQMNDQKSLNPEVSRFGYRAAATYVDKFANDTVGIALGISKTRSPTQNERYYSWGFPQSSQAGGNYTLGGAKPYVQSSMLDRTGFVGTLEFRPNDRVHTTIDALYTKFKETQYLRGIEFPVSNEWGAPSTILDYTADGGLVTDATIGNVVGVVRNDYNRRDADLYSVGINNVFGITDNINLTIDGSWSRAERTDFLLENYSATGYNLSGAKDTVHLSLMPDGRYQIVPTLNYADPSNFVITDPRGWGYNGTEALVQAGFLNQPRFKDDLKAIRASLDGSINSSFLNRWEVGAVYSHRTKDSLYESYFLCPKDGDSSCTVSSGTLQEAPIPSQAIVGTVPLAYLGVPGMIAMNPLYLYDNVYDAEFDNRPDSLARDYNVTENVLTGYASLNIDAQLGDMPLTGNAGVQVVHTDQSSSGRLANLAVIDGVPTVTFTDAEDGGKYTDILPSLALSLRMSPSLYLKGGVSKTMVRPRMDQERITQNVGIDFGKLSSTDPANSAFSSSGGNPRLQPYRSWNFDGSLENYFEKGGYIALAVYYKQLEKFVDPNNSTIYDFADLAANLPPDIQAQIGTTQGRLSYPANTGNGHIFGQELSASLPFANFVPALDGFGVLGSIAHVDSKVRYANSPSAITVPGFSKWVGTAEAYYEKYGFQARLSYRYRSSFLAEISGLSAAPEFRIARPEGILDAQIGYEFQPGSPLAGLSILAQAKNITDRPFVTAESIDPRMVRDYQHYGRDFYLGISYKIAAAPPPPAPVAALPPPPPPVATQTCPNGSVIAATDACPAPPPPPPPPPPAPVERGERGQ